MAMSSHYCHRCGTEYRYTHSNWADRHPTATVFLAVFTVASITAWPWVLAVLAVVAVVYLIDRENNRRTALAARADSEHAELMAALAAPLPRLRREPQRRTDCATTVPIRRAG